MSRMALLFIVLIGVAIPLEGQSCLGKPVVAPLQQEVTEQNDHFKWYSAYSPAADRGNGNDFVRYVQNLGPNLLKFEWTAGGMSSNGLSPGERQRVCIDYGQPVTLRGPLYHGRMNASTDTKVFRSEGEPPKHIMSRFESFFSENGVDPRVELTLESKFDGERYSYWLRNLGPVAVRVSWQVSPHVDLFQQLQKQGPSLARSSPFIAREKEESKTAEQLKKGRVLQPEQTIPLGFASTSKPKALWTNLEVGSLEGHSLAAALLPILVPER